MQHRSGWQRWVVALTAGVAIGAMTAASAALGLQRVGIGSPALDGLLAFAGCTPVLLYFFLRETEPAKVTFSDDV